MLPLAAASQSAVRLTRIATHLLRPCCRPFSSIQKIKLCPTLASCPGVFGSNPADSKMDTRSATTVERLADELEKPELDDRSYRVIRLANKLEALLVHDPETDKASASVNVNVGSFSDAGDMPGMAHAVEHLLFMGTKKFPKENAYSQYLSSHSGHSNAYTAATETNYYFEVAASAGEDSSEASSELAYHPLYGALDRFSQFFISPLFLAETLDRELRAVDSENKKNLQSDLWRLMQLNKSTSNPKHPYHHFSTGNLQTLRDEPRKRGVEIRKAFMDFHDKHYSANRMKLVVLGKESLDTLEEWVSELFKDVPNKELPRNYWSDPAPLSESELLTQTFAKPVMDSRALDIHFLYQDEENLFDVQPGHYISHLIGHEGPGSILAYIKAKGWANGLSSGAMPICPGSALFTIDIKLTEDGLANYQEIIKVVFQYISMIKSASPQEWIVDEMKGLAEVGFRFRQKSPASRFTSNTSSVMQKPIPREWLLSGQRLIRRFDAQAIQRALDCLTSENYRITIVSQQYPGGWDQKEKWYGTEYKIEKIPDDLRSEVRKAMEGRPEDRIPDLHLPHKNEFIPSNLGVEKKEVTEPAKAPKLLRNDSTVRLWWKKDDRFWVPKASYLVSLRCPHAAVTPEDAAKAYLYVDLVSDALVEYAYDAELAGLDYAIKSVSTGIDIELSGYNDKMHVLLDKVLQTVRNLEVKADRFKIVKEKLYRSFCNWEFQQPYSQVSAYSRWLSKERSWITEDYVAVLPSINAADVATFYPTLLDQCHIEVLAQGNVYKEDALRMTSLVESTLNTRAYPSSQWAVRRNLVIPSGSDYTWRKVLADPANVNNCIEYYLHLGQLSDSRLRAVALLFGQLTEEQAFDQLRTKEQLGYIVWSGARTGTTTIAYRVIVQSERSCEYLEQRINAFLALAGRTIRAMSDSEFEGYRRSIINKRLEKPKSLDAEVNRFWAHIISEYYHFEQVDTDVALLRQISRQEVLDFFDKAIDPTSEQRAKLSVHVVSQTSASEAGANSATPEEKNHKVLGMLEKFLNSQGVSVDSTQLAARCSSVDVTEGKPAAISAAVRSYLVEDAKTAADRADAIVEQGNQLLGTVLPGLGIELRTADGGGSSSSSNSDDSGATSPLPEAPATRRTTYIDDVAAWKAGLELTPGPRPVRDLSEYEETEAKL